jgi:two-component system, NarL family, sensor kinase
MGPVSRAFRDTGEGVEVRTAAAGPAGAVPPLPRWLTVPLLVVAVGLALCWIAVAKLTAPADGTVTHPHPVAPLWTAAGARIAQVSDPTGRLHEGDLVIAVDGIPLENWVRDRPDRIFTIGQRVEYTVTRPGLSTSVQVPVTLREYPLREIAAGQPGVLPLGLAMPAVASFVFVRRPRDRAARALFALGVLLPFGALEYLFGTQVIDLANGPRVWPTVAGNVVNALVWAALLHFTIVFPEPRGIVARRPRLIVAVYVLPFALHAVLVLGTVAAAAGALARLAVLVPVSVAAAHVFPFLIAAAAFRQYRLAADAGSRQRLRWIVVAICVIAACYLGLGQVPDKLVAHPLVPWQWVGVLFLPFPLLLAAGVLRYQLFDIQVVLRRSLLYGTVTALLVGVYIAVIALLGRVTGLAPLIATAVVAVLFQPLRSVLHRLTGRLVFGARDDPYEVLTRLGAQLESTAEATALLGGTVTTLARALRLPYAAIELADAENRPVIAASFGAPTATPARIPLVHQGTELGQLLLDAGPTREQFGPADRRLLDVLARQIAVTAHNVQLTARLQLSLQQAVTAREEERRRLRRDIHDGIGPTLAAAGIQLAVARRTVRPDPGRAEELLDALVEGQRGLLTDVRRLVDNLRPPVLDQLGLVGGLRQAADRFAAGSAGDTIRVEVLADDVEPLPAAVEVAAYLIVLESLTNTARHAGARSSSVELRRDGAALLIEVRDDGPGLPTGYRAGVGLSSIRERAVELGGSAVIGSAPGGGTLVSARIPLSAGPVSAGPVSAGPHRVPAPAGPQPHDSGTGPHPP